MVKLLMGLRLSGKKIMAVTFCGLLLSFRLKRGERMLEPMFKMYQEVIFAGESFKDTFFGKPVTVKNGQRGVIMLINKAAHVPHVGYEVEFFDETGDTVAVSSVKESEIAPCPEDSPNAKKVKQGNGKSKSRAA